MTKPSPLGMAALIVDGYLLAFFRIHGIPDFADYMSTIVFPLGWVTKPGRAVSAEPLYWCSWFVFVLLFWLFPVCVGNKTGRAILLSCSVVFFPFVLGPRLVDPAEMLCWLFSLCTGTKTSRAVSAEMLLPRAPTQGTAVPDWARGPADQVFCQVHPVFFNSTVCRWCSVSAAQGPRPCLRLHLLVLSLRPDTLSLCTRTSIIYLMGSAVYHFEYPFPPSSTLSCT